MTRAIQIIQADMRDFFAAGFSLKQYTIDHALSALIAEGINPKAIPATPAYIVNAALMAHVLDEGKE